MNPGDPDGFGHYGVVDEDADGLLCHECGRRFTHLGLHAFNADELSAAEYRVAHGLARSRGLVVSETRATLAENARRSLPGKAQFKAARDPAAATAARRAAGSKMSPEGLAASRSRTGHGRLGIVVVCEWCSAEFCPPVERTPPTLLFTVLREQGDEDLGLTLSCLQIAGRSALSLVLEPVQDAPGILHYLRRTAGLPIVILVLVVAADPHFIGEGVRVGLVAGVLAVRAPAVEAASAGLGATLVVVVVAVDELLQGGGLVVAHPRARDIQVLSDAITDSLLLVPVHGGPLVRDPDGHGMPDGSRHAQLVGEVPFPTVAVRNHFVLAPNDDRPFACRPVLPPTALPPTRRPQRRRERPPSGWASSRLRPWPLGGRRCTPPRGPRRLPVLGAPGSFDSYTSLFHQGSGSDDYLELIATSAEACWVSNSLKANLGAQVRDLRRSRGLTQEGLAEELGVTPRHLAGIERGERNLTLDSVDALAEQLGVTSAELLSLGERR